MTMLLNARQDDTLAFLAFPAKRAKEQVTGTTEDIFRNIGKVLTDILRDVLSKRTSELYTEAREQHFMTYMEVMLGLGKLINATVPRPVIDRLTVESLAEMEADFREHGAHAFGEEMKNQALFTVWTLRKINELADRVTKASVDAHLIPADREMASKFVGNVLYGRFHLDCLNMSLRENTPIYPDVLECISEGLRNVVNAYAYIKQAADLRGKQDDGDLIHIEFDDEEKDLLSSSMLDALGA